VIKKRNGHEGSKGFNNLSIESKKTNRFNSWDGAKKKITTGTKSPKKFGVAVATCASHAARTAALEGAGSAFGKRGNHGNVQNESAVMELLTSWRV
jgi:hypothetical protein